MHKETCNIEISISSLVFVRLQKIELLFSVRLGYNVNTRLSESYEYSVHFSPECGQWTL